MTTVEWPFGEFALSDFGCLSKHFADLAMSVMEELKPSRAIAGVCIAIICIVALSAALLAIKSVVLKDQKTACDMEPGDQDNQLQSIKNVTALHEAQEDNEESEAPREIVAKVHRPVRFRRLRKRAAKITGVHGVFRKKQKDENEATEMKSCQKINLPRRNANDSVRPQEPTEKMCEWDCQPGTIGYLTKEHESALDQLTTILFGDGSEQHLRHCTAHEQEDRSRMLLRFLRAKDFDVNAAAKALHEHSDFWHSFGMDQMRPEDEYCDVDSAEGLYFSCGRDKFGHPVMVARPCVHLSKNAHDSERAVRRTVYSTAKCCETRISGNSDGMVMIYDCKGVKAANCDLEFARNLISILDPHFPERVVVILVVNNSWVIQGLWSLIAPMLDPDTRKKIVMCGSGDFKEAKKWLGNDHPYLKRFESRKKTKSRSVSNITASDDSVSTSSMPRHIVTTPLLSNHLLKAPKYPEEELMFVVSDPRKLDVPVIHVSDAFLRCTGYTASSFLGRNCRRLKGSGTSVSSCAFIREALADVVDETKVCGGLVCTILNYRNDGSAFWNELHIAPVRSPHWHPDKKQWIWQTRLLIGVQIDRTSSLRSVSGFEGDPSTWDVPALAHRLQHVEPPSLKSTGRQNEDDSTSTMDPAQAIAFMVEQSLQEEILNGSFDACTSANDHGWLLALHTRFLELKVSLPNETLQCGSQT